MNINLLDKQYQVLKSQAPVTILTTDRAEGATTSLFFKALDYGYESVVFSNNAKQTMTHFIQWFEKLFEKSDIKAEPISNLMGGFKLKVLCSFSEFNITFLNQNVFVDHARVLGLNTGLFLWDDVHLAQDIDYRDIQYLVDKVLSKRQQVIFTSDRVSNGWRNPRYDRGEILYDNLGNMVLEDVSWDYGLIDWNNNDLKRHQSTRCGVENYKDFVKVI